VVPLPDEIGPERRGNEIIDVAVGDFLVIKNATEVDGADQTTRELVDVGVAPNRTFVDSGGKEVP
jgi:hypothetical protein